MTALAVVTVVAAAVAARAAGPVLLPLVLALFGAGVLGPLELRLSRRMPRGAAAVVCLAVAVVALSVLVGVLALAVWELHQVTGGVTGLLERLDSLAASRGLPPPSGWLTLPGGRAALATAAGVGAQVVLTLAFLTLGLLELEPGRTKLARLDVGRRAARIVDRIARTSGRFLLVRSGLGLVSGLLIGGVSALAGLELALVSGVLAFLLGYIPSIGTVLAVLPPSVFALVQFGVGWRAAAVIAGCAASEIFMFNFVNHIVLGRVLVVPPLLIVASVLTWGLLWGPVGAFLGVPLTMAVLIVVEELNGDGALQQPGRSMVELWARISRGSRGS